VQLPDGAAGTTVSGVVRGSPAAAAGLRAGDTITAVGGAAIDRPDALSDAPAGHRPQDRVAVAWTDTAGASHSATVTLATGPADQAVSRGSRALRVRVIQMGPKSRVRAACGSPAPCSPS